MISYDISLQPHDIPVKSSLQTAFHCLLTEGWLQQAPAISGCLGIAGLQPRLDSPDFNPNCHCCGFRDPRSASKIKLQAKKKQSDQRIMVDHHFLR